VPTLAKQCILTLDALLSFNCCRYILSDQLFLNSYQVLRGAGRDYTNLRFTRSLVDLRGWGANYTAGRGKSPHTWAGAMITNQQQQQGVFAPKVNLHLGRVAKPAKRGDTRLYVWDLVRNASSAEILFQPGQWYTLAMAENAEVSRAVPSSSLGSKSASLKCR
jgi:hypothetical protein